METDFHIAFKKYEENTWRTEKALKALKKNAKHFLKYRKMKNQNISRKNKRKFWSSKKYIAYLNGKKRYNQVGHSRRIVW